MSDAELLAVLLAEPRDPQQIAIACLWSVGRADGDIFREAIESLERSATR